MSEPETDRKQEPGAPSSEGATSELDARPGNGPLSYLREAIRIARFDGDAIARASRDRRAILYGAGFLAISTLATYVSEWLVSGPDPVEGPVPTWVLFVLGMVVVLPLQVLVSAISVGVIHGAAKVLFGATGRYLALLRVLWLGSVVQCLNVIPIVGGLVGGVWFLLITLVTFEEVDGVERLQALALVITLGVLMFLASRLGLLGLP